MLQLQIKRLGAAVLFAAALAVSGHAASSDPAPAAADPGATKGSDSLFPQLPDEGSESRLPGAGFSFLRRDSSVGGVAGGGSGMASRELPSARVLEQLDRRRNWIYATQSPSSFELSAEQALGVRSSEPTRGPGEPEGWLADFFYDRGAQLPRSQSTDDPFSKTLQFPSVTSTLFGGAIAVPGLSDLSSGLGLPPFQASQAGRAAARASEPGVTGNPGLSEAGLSSVPTSIRELLGHPGSVNPLPAGFDPINLRVDTTQEELNPTMPQRPTDYNATPRTVDALLDRPLQSADSSRSSLLDSFNSRMLGDSSLAPAAAAAPPPTVRIQDRPLGSGQFPSRKF